MSISPIINSVRIRSALIMLALVAYAMCRAFPYDFADAQHFMDRFEHELEQRNEGAGEVLRQVGIDVRVMGRLLRERIPYIISKQWQPSGSHAVLGAQLEDIMQAMERVRGVRRPSSDADTDADDNGDGVAPGIDLSENLPRWL